MKLGIDTFERRLAKNPTPPLETIQRLLEAQKRQLRRLPHRVEDMRDTTRLSLHDLPLRPTRADLTELAQAALEQFRATLELEGCEIRTDFGPELPGQWDPLRVVQGLSHLLANASRYAKGKPVHLTTQRSEDGRFAQGIVADDGDGIAPIDHERIFERFERASQRAPTQGLGLFIARQIAEAHGGSLRVESQPGQGARFVLSLPRTVDTRAGVG